MPQKNFERRLTILPKKSVIGIAVVMALILWLTYDQYSNYEESYFHVEKSLVNIDVPFTSEATGMSETTSSSFKTMPTTSSSFETTSTLSSSVKPTNRDKSVNGLVTTASSLTVTVTSREVNIWFRKLIQLTDIKQSDTNIFFIETSCSTEGLMKANSNSAVVHLNPRQCCSVESAALTNRNHSVYILHTCPLNVTIYEQSPAYVKEMLTNPNVHIVYLKLSEIFEGSPVEGLFHTDKLATSRYPIEHLSDVLRQLVLWKFGGTYIDLDTINIRPLDDLKSNYAGWQDDGTVANGLLNFKYDGAGHDIVTECLKELNDVFDGSQWSNNGPELVTRILIRMCKFKTVYQLANEKCDSFTIYPPKYFYPIYYPNFRIFFNKVDSQKIPDMFIGTYNIHFWNKMSSKSVIEVGKNQLYGVLADKYCPGVYHNCGKYF